MLMKSVELEGTILDVGYTVEGSAGAIRLALKTKDRAYYLSDPSFHPYFYLFPESGRIKK